MKKTEIDRVIKELNENVSCERSTAIMHDLFNVVLDGFTFNLVFYCSFSLFYKY